MSRNPLLWKFVLILVVVVLAAFAFYPPEEKINLGLDLRGGAHILMEGDTDATLKWEMDAIQSRVGQALTQREIPYASVVSSGPGTLEVRGTDPARSSDEGSR